MREKIVNFCGDCRWEWIEPLKDLEADGEYECPNCKSRNFGFATTITEDGERLRKTVWVDQDFEIKAKKENTSNKIKPTTDLCPKCKYEGYEDWPRWAVLPNDIICCKGCHTAFNKTTGKEEPWEKFPFKK